MNQRGIARTLKVLSSTHARLPCNHHSQHLFLWRNLPTGKSLRRSFERIMAVVTLVNCFDVPAGQEDEFFTLWQQVNTYMRQKKGYLEHKLHRSLAPDAPFRFINVARWASIEDFDAAHDEGFRALVTHPVWASFRSHPALYEVVHEAHAGDEQPRRAAS
jgi:heme-degrading monooxygenase HmoA